MDLLDIKDKKLRRNQIFIERIAYFLITSIATYAATELRVMSKSISTLNENFAGLIKDVANQKESIDDLSERVKVLERRRR